MIFIRVLVTFAVRLCQVKAYHTELAQYSDYRMFQNFTLSPLAQAGIDNRAPFFSRWIRWTPPSFQWHNPVSACLVSAYERPIIAGVRILIVSSTLYHKLHPTSEQLLAITESTFSWGVNVQTN